MHNKSCHKIIELNKEEIVVTKKRKTIDENAVSGKKTKSEEKFKCDDCSYIAQSKKSLKNHKETSCEGLLE